MTGKAAVETETATAFTKIEDKLFAKLKTAILPAIKVEAMAVVAIVFNCPAPKPKDLWHHKFYCFYNSRVSEIKIWPVFKSGMKRMPAAELTNAKLRQAPLPMLNPASQTSAQKIQFRLLFLSCTQGSQSRYQKSVKDLQNSAYHI